MKCWCGCGSFRPFSSTYGLCADCGTLVSERAGDIDPTHVLDDEHGLYGREYWFSHQEDSGYPNIVTRARADLPERCCHWLRTTLKYKLPPGRVLELGSGSGAFVALLRRAGFEATGLELSPWVVRFSEQTFDIPVLQGPIEDHDLTPGSLDLVAAMDVIEHLPDPLATMEKCLRLVKPDGVLIIQTPCLPAGVSYDELIRAGYRFAEMLKAEEHLYLFSRSSISEFFRRLGAADVVLEPAIFSHYDMFLVVSQATLVAHSPAEVEACLTVRSEGRIVLALMDAWTRFCNLLDEHNNSEADREARLEQIEALTAQARSLRKHLAKVEADRAARLADVEKLTGMVKAGEQRLQEVEADRAARLADVEKLTGMVKAGEQRLQEVEADRAARLVDVEKLTAMVKAGEQRLQEVEADRAAGLVALNARIRSLSQALEKNQYGRRLLKHLRSEEPHDQGTGGQSDESGS